VVSTGTERPRADGVHDPEVARLTPEGDLDARSVQDLRNELDIVLRDEAITTVIIDLRLVRFVDSSGLGALVAARTHAEVTGTRLLLRNPGTQLRRLMTVTGTYEAFTWE
jgi:anti-sigma B factor antagonist